MRGSDRKKTRIPQSHWSSNVTFTPEFWHVLESAGATLLDDAVRSKLKHLAGVYRDRTAMLRAGEPVLDVKKKLQAFEQAAAQFAQALRKINEKNHRSARNRLLAALATKRQTPVNFSTELESISIIAAAARSAIEHLPEGKNEADDPNLAALIFCSIGVFRDDAKGGGPYSLNSQRFVHAFCSSIGVRSEHLPKLEISDQVDRDSAFYKMVKRAMDRFNDPENEPPPFDWTECPSNHQ